MTTQTDIARNWNIKFTQLNPRIPYNAKAEPIEYRKYLKGILSSPVGNQYKNPDDYPNDVQVTVDPVIPTVHTAPEVITYNLLFNNVLANLQVLRVNAVNQVAFIDDMISKLGK